MRYFWFGESIKEAVDAPRIHHQLFPMDVAYEYGVMTVKIRLQMYILINTHTQIVAALYIFTKIYEKI